MSRQLRPSTSSYRAEPQHQVVQVPPAMYDTSVSSKGETSASSSRNSTTHQQQHNQHNNHQQHNHVYSTHQGHRVHHQNLQHCQQRQQQNMETKSDVVVGSNTTTTSVESVLYFPARTSSPPPTTSRSNSMKALGGVRSAAASASASTTSSSSREQQQKILISDPSHQQHPHKYWQQQHSSTFVEPFQSGAVGYNNDRIPPSAAIGSHVATLESTTVPAVTSMAAKMKLQEQQQRQPHRVGHGVHSRPSVSSSNKGTIPTSRQVVGEINVSSAVSRYTSDLYSIPTNSASKTTKGAITTNTNTNTASTMKLSAAQPTPQVYSTTFASSTQSEPGVGIRGSNAGLTNVSDRLLSSQQQQQLPYSDTTSAPTATSSRVPPAASRATASRSSFTTSSSVSSSLPFDEMTDRKKTDSTLQQQQQRQQQRQQTMNYPQQQEQNVHHNSSKLSSSAAAATTMTTTAQEYDIRDRIRRLQQRKEERQNQRNSINSNNSNIGSFGISSNINNNINISKGTASSRGAEVVPLSALSATSTTTTTARDMAKLYEQQQQQPISQSKQQLHHQYQSHDPVHSHHTPYSTSKQQQRSVPTTSTTAHKIQDYGPIIRNNTTKGNDPPSLNQQSRSRGGSSGIAGARGIGTSRGSNNLSPLQQQTQRSRSLPPEKRYYYKSEYNNNDNNRNAVSSPMNESDEVEMWNSNNNKSSINDGQKLHHVDTGRGEGGVIGNVSGAVDGGTSTVIRTQHVSSLQKLQYQGGRVALIETPQSAKVRELRNILWTPNEHLNVSVRPSLPADEMDYYFAGNHSSNDYNGGALHFDASTGASRDDPTVATTSSGGTAKFNRHWLHYNGPEMAGTRGQRIARSLSPKTLDQRRSIYRNNSDWKDSKHNNENKDHQRQQEDQRSSSGITEVDSPINNAMTAPHDQHEKQEPQESVQKQPEGTRLQSPSPGVVDSLSDANNSGSATTASGSKDQNKKGIVFKSRYYQAAQRGLNHNNNNISNNNSFYTSASGQQVLNTSRESAFIEQTAIPNNAQEDITRNSQNSFSQIENTEGGIITRNENPIGLDTYSNAQSISVNNNSIDSFKKASDLENQRSPRKERLKELNEYCAKLVESEHQETMHGVHDTLEPTFTTTASVSGRSDETVESLIAKLGRIRRDNPQAALAQIDAILKANSQPAELDPMCHDINLNYINDKQKAIVSNPRICSLKTTSGDGEANEEKKDDTNVAEDENSEDDSFFDETTVSSITNPSYASNSLHLKASENDIQPISSVAAGRPRTSSLQNYSNTNSTSKKISTVNAKTAMVSNPDSRNMDHLVKMTSVGSDLKGSDGQGRNKNRHQQRERSPPPESINISMGNKDMNPPLSHNSNFVQGNGVPAVKSSPKVGIYENTSADVNDTSVRYSNHIPNSNHATSSTDSGVVDSYKFADDVDAKIHRWDEMSNNVFVSPSNKIPVKLNEGGTRMEAPAMDEESEVNSILAEPTISKRDHPWDDALYSTKLSNIDVRDTSMDEAIGVEATVGSPAHSNTSRGKGKFGDVDSNNRAALQRKTTDDSSINDERMNNGDEAFTSTRISPWIHENANALSEDFDAAWVSLPSSTFFSTGKTHSRSDSSSPLNVNLSYGLLINNEEEEDAGIQSMATDSNKLDGAQIPTSDARYQKYKTLPSPQTEQTKRFAESIPAAASNQNSDYDANGNFDHSLRTNQNSSLAPSSASKRRGLRSFLARKGIGSFVELGSNNSVAGTRATIDRQSFQTSEVGTSSDINGDNTILQSQSHSRGRNVLAVPSCSPIRGRAKSLDDRRNRRTPSLARKISRMLRVYDTETNGDNMAEC